MDNQEQKATSLHLMAVAYRMLSKPQEVLRNEQQALAIWRQIGQKRGLAFSLNEMAGPRLRSAKPKMLSPTTRRPCRFGVKSATSAAWATL